MQYSVARLDKGSAWVREDMLKKCVSKNENLIILHKNKKITVTKAQIEKILSDGHKTVCGNTAFGIEYTIYEISIKKYSMAQEPDRQLEMKFR